MPNTTSPNMGLIVPTVSQEPGPQWANDINSDLAILDQHNHSNGQGVLITPSGLNINSDLPFNGNNAILLNTARFNNLVSPIAASSPNLCCIFASNNELYYNDGAGNQVQITLSGSVNATSSGISSGTATASFSAGVLVVNQATNTPGNIQAGSILIGNNVSGSNFATLQAPSALASNYSLTLPPTNGTGSTAFMTIDTSNNMGEGPAVTGGITLSNLSSSTIQTLSPSGSITMYGGASAPSGWIICDGTSYLRATYPNLFTAIGTAYGTADSTHFNVPDFRGVFPRGVSGASGNDPDASSRTLANTGGNSGNNVGSFQTSEFASHYHAEVFDENGTGPGDWNTATGQSGNTPFEIGTTDDTGGNETRPINLYVNFIIKT